MIRFSLTSVFDAEGVCPGDILISKATGGYYFVVNTSAETEEFVCVKKGDVPIRDSVVRIGFEMVDLYTKVNIYDADGE